MKTVKKITGLCLVLMMVLSLLVPVSAADAWFGEGFEGTVAQVKETWTTTNDTRWSLATNRVHTGNQSLKMTAYNAISFTLNPEKAEIKKGVYEIWMYDGAEATGRNNLSVTTSDGKTVIWGTLYKNTNYYMVTANNESAVTSAVRKTGWRQIVLDLTQPLANMYIDGVQCLTNSNSRLSADQLNLINAFKIYITGTGSGDCYWDDLAFYDSYADVPQHPSSVIGSAKFASGTDVADATGITADDGSITLTFSKAMSTLSASQVKVYQRASTSTNDGDFVEVTGVTASGITDTAMTIQIPNLSYLKTYKLEYVGLKSSDGKAVAQDFITFNTADEVPARQLIVQKTGNGAVSYQGAEISDPVNVTEGTTPELSIVPANGWKIGSVTVGGVDQTAQVTNRKLTLAAITGNVTVEVTFEQLPAFQAFTEGFEGTVAQVQETWTTTNDTKWALATNRVHTGNQSLKMTAYNAISFTIDQVQKGVYEFWMYDQLGASGENQGVFSTSTGKSVKWGTLVNQPNYYLLTANNEPQKMTSVRQDGWRQIVLDANDRLLDVYVDGTLIVNDSNSRLTLEEMDLINEFKLQLTGKGSGDCYWDDVSIYQTLAEVPKHPSQMISSVKFASGTDVSNATGIVPADGDITIAFLKDMNTLSANQVKVYQRDSESVSDADFVEVSGVTASNITASSMTMKLPALSYHKTYKLEYVGMSDAQGNAMAQDFITFTTAPSAPDANITLEVVGQGTVEINQVSYQDGDVVSVENGSSTEISVTPAEGYLISSISDALVTDITGTTYNLVVSSDIQLKVEFIPYPTQDASSIAAFGDAVVMKYEEKNAAVSFAKIICPIGWKIDECGMNLAEKDTGKEIKLPSSLNVECFGIKVYGSAFETGVNYTFQPYATLSKISGEDETEKEGEAIEFTFSED